MAAQVAEELGDKAFAARMLANVGGLYQSTGDYSKALAVCVSKSRIDTPGR